MIGLVPKLQTFVVSSFNWSDGMKAFLTAPGGPFTIHFWCPFAKWLISINNIYDLFYLETSKISMNYQFVIFLTGTAYCRFSLRIKPINYHLAVCNGFMGFTGFYQMTRKFLYDLKHKNTDLPAIAEAEAKQKL